MGTDKVASVNADSITAEQGWKQFLTINLKMKASDAFKTLPMDEEKLAEIEDEKEQEEYR